MEKPLRLSWNSSLGSRIKQIGTLRSHVKAGAVFSQTELKRLFKHLGRCIGDENHALCQPTMQLIAEMADIFSDFPSYFPSILPPLISQLGHPKSSVRRTSVGTIISLVQQFHNVNTLSGYIVRHGFHHANAKVRQGSMLVIPQFFDIDPSLDLEYLLPHLLEQNSDISYSVRESSEQVVAYLRSKSSQLHPKALQALQKTSQSSSLFQNSEGSGHIGFSTNPPLSSRRSQRKAPRVSRTKQVRSSSEIPDLNGVLSHSSYGTPRTPNFGPSTITQNDPSRFKRRPRPVAPPVPPIDNLGLTAKGLGTQTIHKQHSDPLDFDLEDHLDDIIYDPCTPTNGLSVNEQIFIKDTQIKDDVWGQFLDDAPVSPNSQKLSYCTSTAQLIPATHPNNFLDNDARTNAESGIATAPTRSQKEHTDVISMSRRPATEKSVSRKKMASRLNLLKRKKRASSAHNSHGDICSSTMRQHRNPPKTRRIKSEGHTRRIRIRDRGNDVLSAPTTNYDLLPISQDPNEELQKVLRWLRSDHWKENFDGLNSIRRLGEAHPTLVSSHLCTLVPLFAKAINSLRSSLSRAAIITCRELFQFFGKKFEPYLEDLVPALIKRAGEITNEFLCKETDEAIRALIENISPSRTIIILLHQCNSKSPTVRMMIATYFGVLVTQSGSSVLKSKYYGRLVKKVADFLGEGKIIIRTSAKQLLFNIIGLYRSSQAFLDDIKKYLTSSQFYKVQQIVGKGPDQNLLVSRKNSKRVPESSYETISTTSTRRDSWSD